MIAPGPLEPFDDRLVPVRDKVFEKLRPKRCANAGRQMQVLDGDRYPQQGRQFASPHHGRLGGAGLLAGQFVGAGHNGRQFWIDAIDLGQYRVDNFDGRDAPRADGCGGQVFSGRPA